MSDEGQAAVTGPVKTITNEDLRDFMVRRFDQLHLDMANNYIAISTRVTRLERLAAGQASNLAMNLGAAALLGMLAIKLWVTFLR